jgi:hypothetical protein
MKSGIWLGLAIAAAAAAGCKVDPNRNVDAGLDASEVDVDATGGTDDDAAPGDDAGAELRGPVVQVLAPEAPAAGDFSSDAILTRSSVRVRCRAEPNEDSRAPVDTSSVRVLVRGGGEVVEASAQPALAAREYEAEMSLAEFSNGALSVACEATDTRGEEGRAEISTYLDLGPRIQIVNPVADAAYANRLDIFVLVEAAPVAADDDGAAPYFESVEIVVSGEVLDDVSFDADEGVFEASVLFEDFDPELQGDNTLVVRATNTREGEPVTREERVVFNADGSGPVIEVTSPEPGDLVAGLFSVTATVTDDAGVDHASVVATIAGTHEFRLFPVASDTYVGSFDTRELGRDLVFPTVVVRARDAVGNESQFGFLLALDNEPPILSLDPPLMRETRRNTEGALECSLEFHPLGDDAAKDGQTVPQLTEIRARIEDLGNGALSTPGVVVRRAGVNHNTVQLFILDDAEGALLVDTTGDEQCDSINPLLVPTSVPQADNEAAVLNLVPLDPTGSSHFTEQDPLPLGCAEIEGDTPAPSEICFQSPATRQIATELGGEPAIFSIAPITEDQCWGFAFDSVAANISDGFACLAVRAEDNLGNKGISPPLRLCFDAQGQGTACPEPIGSINPGPLPNCTGTFDPETQTVDTSKPCNLPFSFANNDAFQRRRIDL